MAIEASFCNPSSLVQMRDDSGFLDKQQYIRMLCTLWNNQLTVLQQLGRLTGEPLNPCKIWRTWNGSMHLLLEEYGESILQVL
jgi:hypothetical protein